MNNDLIRRQAVLDKLNRLIEVERLQGTDEMGYGRERVSAYESMIFEIESEYLYPSVSSSENPNTCEDDKPCTECLQYDHDNHNCPHFCHVIKGVLKEQPNKLGMWIERFDESGKWYECDQCHTDWGGAVNFCPNCGARM